MYDYDFPTIDFKFNNTGNATGFLWQFVIDVIDSEIDVKPVLDFHVNVIDYRIEISVTNRGYGKAINLKIEINEPTINLLFPSLTKQKGITINSGETKSIFSFDRKMIDTETFGFIYKLFLRLEKIHGFYYPQLPILGEGIEIENINITYSYKDEKRHQYEENKQFRTLIVFSSEGFFEKRYHSPCAMIMRSDTTYISMIDPSKGRQQLIYPISRKIPLADIDRFHIMIGASMSCKIKVQFLFFIDKTDVIESEVFVIHIWNPINSGWQEKYTDGRNLARFKQMNIDSLRENFHQGINESFALQERLSYYEGILREDEGRLSYYEGRLSHHEKIYQNLNDQEETKLKQEEESIMSHLRYVINNLKNDIDTTKQQLKQYLYDPYPLSFLKIECHPFSNTFHTNISSNQGEK